MALVEVGQVQTVGIIKDTANVNLPLHAWTDGLNVEFTSTEVRPLPQEVGLFFGMQTNPYGLWPYVQDADNQDWVYAGLNKIYSISPGNAHTDITRVSGDYDANEAVKWNGGILNGLLVINNGTDVPQKIDPVDITAPAIDLPNWPAGLQTQVLRPFKVFLIAIGVSDIGIERPSQTLVWSTPADPGQVPASWDYASVASKAGVKTFSESEGILVDGLTLRDEFMVYKTDSIWAMRFVGGEFVMSFKPRFEGLGLLVAGAVVAYKQFHFVVTENDIIVHNGITSDSVADQKIKQRLFKDINPMHLDRVFVVHAQGDKSIWVHYPSQASEWCDRAAIWNYDTKTWTFRETPQTVSGSSRYFDTELGTVWDAFGGTWDDSDTSWDAEVFARNRANLILGSIPGAVVTNDGTNSTDGVISWAGTNPIPPLWIVQPNAQKMLGWVRRAALAIAGKDRHGQPTVNKKLVKMFTEIWPEIATGAVMVRVGTQESANGVVDWEDYIAFDPLVDEKVDVMASAKFLVIEFRSPSENTDWTLEGYAVEVVAGGSY